MALYAAEMPVRSNSTPLLSAVGARRPRYGLPHATIVVLALAVCVPVADRFAYYCDDFSFRLLVADGGVRHALTTCFGSLGVIRPVGWISLLSIWYGPLWDWPLLHHLLLFAMYALLCVLVYGITLDLGGDRRAALVAAAVFAVWPTGTEAVVWTSAAAEILPAALLTLPAMRLFVRSLRADAPRAVDRRLLAAWLLFLLSALFHDQHLGMCAVFSALVVLIAKPSSRRRWLVRTIPFHVAALAVGAMSICTSAGTDRPLDPGVRPFVQDFGGTVHEFVVTSLWQPLRQWMLGNGVAALVLEWWTYDRDRLVVAVVLLAIALATFGALLRRADATRTAPARFRVPTVVGLSVIFVTLGILAAGHTRADSRHMLWPAMGAAMVVGAATASVAARRRAGAAATTIAVVAAVAVLAASRLGATYEWVMRARIASAMFDDLRRLCPDAPPGTLIVVDGVRAYGRGFIHAGNLSSQARLRCRMPVRLTTVVTRGPSGLLANEPPDPAWPVGPESRFFRWDAAAFRLEPASRAEYVSRHGLGDSPPSRGR